MTRVLTAGLVLSVFLAAGVQAATVTAPLDTYAEVLAAGTCTVNANSSFFTITPPVTAPIDQQGYIWVLCPVDTPYQIALTTGGSGNFAQREMSGSETPANKVLYNIFTDYTFGVIWGDGSGSTGTVAGTGTGLSQVHYPGVRVVPQPTPPAGNYVDSVIVTVIY